MAPARRRLAVVALVVVAASCAESLRLSPSRHSPPRAPHRFGDFRTPWKATPRPRWQSRIWFDPRFAHNHRWESRRTPADASRFPGDLGDVSRDRSDRLEEDEDFYRDAMQDSALSATRAPIEGLWDFFAMPDDRVDETRVASYAEGLAEPLGSMSLVVTAASLVFIVLSMAGVSARTLPSLADVLDNIQTFLFPDSGRKEEIAERVERAVAAYDASGDTRTQATDPRISSIVGSVAKELQPVAHRLARQFDPFSQIAISAAMVLAAYVGYAVINPRREVTADKKDEDIASKLEHLFLEDEDTAEDSVSNASNTEGDQSEHLTETDSQQDDYYTKRFSQSDFSSVTAVSTLSDSKRGTLLSRGERPSVLRPLRENNRYSVKYQSKPGNHHYPNFHTSSNSNDVSGATETYPELEFLFPGEINQPDQNERFPHVADPLSVIDAVSDHTPLEPNVEPMNLYSLLTSDKLAVVDSSSRNKTPVPFLYSSNWLNNRQPTGANDERKDYHVINNASQNDTAQYNNDDHLYTTDTHEFLFEDTSTENVNLSTTQTVNPQRIGLFPLNKPPVSENEGRIKHTENTKTVPNEKGDALDTVASENTQNDVSGPSFFEIITSGYQIANAGTPNNIKSVIQEDQPTSMDKKTQQAQPSQTSVLTKEAQSHSDDQHVDDNTMNYMQSQDNTSHNSTLQYGETYDPQLFSDENNLMQQSEILNYLLKEIATGHLKQQSGTTEYPLLQHGNPYYNSQQILSYPPQQNEFLNHNLQGSFPGYSVHSGVQSFIPQQSQPIVYQNQETINNFQLEQSNINSNDQNRQNEAVNFQQEGITGSEQHHLSGLSAQHQNEAIYQQTRYPDSQENNSGMYYQLQITPSGSDESSNATQLYQSVPDSVIVNHHQETDVVNEINNPQKADYNLNGESFEALLEFVRKQLAKGEPGQVTSQVNSGHPHSDSRPYYGPMGELEELPYIPGGGYTAESLDSVDAVPHDSHDAKYPGNMNQAGSDTRPTLFPTFQDGLRETTQENYYWTDQQDTNTGLSEFEDNGNSNKGDVTESTAGNDSYDELDLLSLLLVQKGTLNTPAATEDTVTVNGHEGTIRDENRNYTQSTVPASVNFFSVNDHEADHKQEYLNRGNKNNKDGEQPYDNEYVWADQKIVNDTHITNDPLWSTGNKLTAVTPVPESLVTWVIPQKISTWSTLSDGSVSLVDEEEKGTTPLPFLVSSAPGTTTSTTTSTTTGPPLTIYEYDSASAASAHLTELPSFVRMSYPSVAPATSTTRGPPAYQDPTRPRANGKFEKTPPSTLLQFQGGDGERTEIPTTFPDEGIFTRQSSVSETTAVTSQRPRNPYTVEMPYTPTSLTKQTRYLTTTTEVNSSSRHKPTFTIGFVTTDSTLNEPTHETRERPTMPITSTPPDVIIHDHYASTTTFQATNTISEATRRPSADTVTNATTSSSIGDEEAVKEVMNAVGLVNKFLCRHAVNEKACVLCLEEVGIRNECYSRRP